MVVLVHAGKAAYSVVRWRAIARAKERALAAISAERG
jgi:hypothetical protein